MNICVIVGTRPEIIKMQPVLVEIKKRNHKLVLVHTGQHYDFMMSDVFINELEISKPDYFLKVKTLSQGMQVGEIIASCDRILESENPDIVLVQGDTNSALGGSIASAKLDLPIGHVEAGCRSFDKHMQEEINRVLISDIATLNFAPTENCLVNLQREGIKSEQIFLTGHPIVDLLNTVSGTKITTTVLDDLGIKQRNYYLVTIHRRENIENKDKISDILKALSLISKEIPIIFPCHPHTELQINKFGLTNYLKKIKTIKTVGYFESLSLIQNARIVLTDSGGIQQESAILGTPCITLRSVTEWSETIEKGLNFLTGHQIENITKTIEFVEKDYSLIMKRFGLVKGLFGKPGTSVKIIEIIEKELSSIKRNILK
jgi:UDP-N-acetylglucosamine 2-epimerase (non-hydrolysing)